MATVRDLQRRDFARYAPHSEVDATYSVIERDGTKTLQINTLGSKNRKIVGKDSQTIRFTADALRQLQRIIKENFDLD